VRTVYDQLRQYGRVKRGTIGAVVQSITATLARALDLPQENGAIVADVDRDGPAGAAGLRVGDIVVSLDGKTIENGRQLEVNLYRRAAGDVAQLEVLRAGQRLRLPVAVGERDDDPMRFADMVTRDEHLIDRLGVLALTLTDALRQELGVNVGVAGALVAARATETAGEYGILPGDLVVSVNRTTVRGLDDFRQLIAKLPANAPCALQVLRQGQFLFLAFELD
jgi:serine protease Do